jgi:hypothetical protein
MPETNTALKELMLADLVRFEDAVWKNEDIGAKRFDFFVTLLTAVTAGLVALWSTDRAKAADFQASLTLWTGRAVLALLVLGLVAYRRMLHRDKITAEYKRTANAIRRSYRSVFRHESPDLPAYKLEFENNNEKEALLSRWTRRRKRIRQMGYTQTLAVMNGVLLVLAIEWTVESQYGWSVAAGLALTVFLCIVGATPHETHSPDPTSTE